MNETPIDLNAARQKKQRKQRPQKQYSTGLVLNKDGNPTAGVANVMFVLSSDEAWDEVLAYDQFSETVTKLRRPPVRGIDGQSEVGVWTDADTTRTASWIASNCDFEPSATHVDSAVEAIARKKAFHPVRQYLQSLRWDGQARLDGLLPDYFRAENTQYTRAIGSKWMISAVARVVRPGCKADCMLVLEGEQGIRKSTALRQLFSDRWFADTPPRIGDKDSYLALRGKWGIEFGELDSLRGRAITAVKNYLSAVQDTYRPPYGRRTQDFARQCVFAGSTNESEYLQDHTGNRRFWPTKVGQVDTDAIARDRDQLWAEAYARYQRGETWYLDTAELEDAARAVVADRETDDPWTSRIAEWLTKPYEASDYDIPGAKKNTTKHIDGVTTADVMTRALLLRESDMHRHDLSIRCGQILRRLGWEPRQKRRNGTSVRVYYPSQSTECHSACVVNNCDRNPA
jgi:putative DNA primase/helicase